MRVVASFSGGETSAYMTYLLKQEIPDLFVVFANTGQENEETLEFVDQCDRAFNLNTVWIEAVINEEWGKGVGYRVVDFKTASRNGEPFEAMIKKYGIPNKSFPTCTRTLKTQALRAACKEMVGDPYYAAIGIRADEWDRASLNAKKEKIIYPLIERGVQKSDVNRFWANQPFRLQLKGYEGNCKWCWKKSDRKLGTIAIEHPERFDFPRRMERLYEGFAPDSQPNRPLPARFFRGNRTVDEIMQIPLLPGFVRADDDTQKTVTIIQGELFNYSEIEGGCSESCEAF